MLPLNLSIEEEVTAPVVAQLETAVRGAYMDFKDSAMYIIVDYMDAAGQVKKTKQICARGEFYSSQNSAIAESVLGALYAGATAVLSTPSPAQWAIDAGDVVIREVPTNYHTATIVMESAINNQPEPV